MAVAHLLAGQSMPEWSGMAGERLEAGARQHTDVGAPPCVMAPSASDGMP